MVVIASMISATLWTNSGRFRLIDPFRSATHYNLSILNLTKTVYHISLMKHNVCTLYAVFYCCGATRRQRWVASNCHGSKLLCSSYRYCRMPACKYPPGSRDEKLLYNYFLMDYFSGTIDCVILGRVWHT